MLVRQMLKLKPAAGVVTIPPGTTVAKAAETLSLHHFGALVVSSDGTTVEGIVSERDIVHQLWKRGTECMTGLVDEMMTTDVTCCGLDDTSDAVLSIMTEGRFRHMPVLEDGVMVGLISIGDVVKARLSELSMEKEALTGMIMGH